MTPAQIIAAKVDGIEAISEGWAASMGKYQPKLARKLRLLVSALTTDSTGAIEMTATNLAAIDEILVGLRDYMSQGEYTTLLKGLADDFTAQQGRTVAFFASTFGGPPPVTTFAAEVYNVGRAQLIRDLIPESLGQSFFNPIRDALTQSVATGASYSQMLETLTDIAQGTDKTDGALLRYSRVLVTDTIGQTDRAYTNIIANELGVQWYKYTGGKMDTTRCFCAKRNNQFFHKREVEGWGMGKGVGECGYPWAGMNKATNAETIFAYVGGYNCQHSLLPVSEASVPKESLVAAMAKGYYKPSKTVKEALGL